MMNEKINKTLVVVILTLNLLLLSRSADLIYEQLQFPFDLNTETADLSSTKIFTSDQNPYAETTYSQAPYNLTMYSPLYFQILSFAPTTENHAFYYGRLLSIICTLITALVLLLIHGQKKNWLLPLFLICCFYLFWPVTFYFIRLRVDAMGLMFSALALWTLSHYRSRSWMLLLTAFLCLMAIGCKQSFVAATVCSVIYLSSQNKKAAIKFILSFSLMAGAAAFYCQQKWGDGFWFSIVDVPASNPIRIDLMLEQVTNIFKQPLFSLLLLISTTLSLISYFKKDKVFFTSPFFIYTLCSLFIALATCGKKGAAENYYVEFILAQLMLLTAYFKNHNFNLVRPLPLFLLFLFSICVSYDVFVVEKKKYSNIKHSKEIENKTKIIRIMKTNVASLEIDDPKMLSVFSVRATLELQKIAYVNDSYLYSLLWQSEKIDVSPLLIDIKNHYFDIIPIPKNGHFPSHFVEWLHVKDIKKYVFAHYQLGKAGQFYDYYVPK